MKHTHSIHFRLGVFILSGIFSVSCTEELPTYVEPTNIFQSALVRTDSTTISYTSDLDSYSSGHVANYQDESYATFRVRNIYEETIQSTVDITGKLEVWPEKVLSEKSVTIVTDQNIVPATAYDNTTKILTLDPGEDLFFRIKINPKAESGTFLHKYAEVEQAAVINRLYTLRYRPMKVNCRFSVQLIKSSSVIVAESSFAMTFYGRITIPPITLLERTRQ